MANSNEIKGRIDSVRETQKITNAMYLIASTKLTKAKSELYKTKPYFTALSTEIKRIFRTVEDVESPYFYPVSGEEPLNGTYACLVVTADKGLAGAYNMNVIREAESMLSEHPDTKLFVVGEYGRHYFNAHHVPIEQSFLYTAQNPTMRRAREITNALLENYGKGGIEKIYVIYTNMKNSVETETIRTRILPFHRADFHTPTVEKKISNPFEFMPNPKTVLNHMMQSYISGFIYSTLVYSFCAEQNSRMSAMDSANRNAEELLADLQIQYNRVRQAAITQEITEVSAGAKAQKKNHEKQIKTGGGLF